METTRLGLVRPRCRWVGNQVPRYSGWKQVLPGWKSLHEYQMLETKYRDIADGNMHPLTAWHDPGHALETKYRDIADGNSTYVVTYAYSFSNVGNQVPRYSGWKLKLKDYP